MVVLSDTIHGVIEYSSELCRTTRAPWPITNYVKVNYGSPSTTLVKVLLRTTPGRSCRFACCPTLSCDRTPRQAGCVLLFRGATASTKFAEARSSNTTFRQSPFPRILQVHPHPVGMCQVHILYRFGAVPYWKEAAIAWPPVPRRSKCERCTLAA